MVAGSAALPRNVDEEPGADACDPDLYHSPADGPRGPARLRVTQPHPPGGDRRGGRRVADRGHDRRAGRPACAGQRADPRAARRPPPRPRSVWLRRSSMRSRRSRSRGRSSTCSVAPRPARPLPRALSPAWPSSARRSRSVSGVFYAILISIRVHDFVSSGEQTYDEAHRLLGGPLLVVVQIAGQAGSLVVAVSFVLISLQAMRVGLLGRLLGYVGMAAGRAVPASVRVRPRSSSSTGCSLSPISSPAAGRAASPPPGGRGRPKPGRHRPRCVLAAWPRAKPAASAAGNARVVTPRLPHSSVDTTTATVEPPQTDGSETRTRAATPKRKRKRRH